MEKRSSILMEQYEIGKQLGQGTFAKVYQARNLKTNSIVAIKVIDKEKVMKAGMREQIKREIYAMRRLNHPNVVSLHEVLASKAKIYFAMEFVKGGELFHRVARGRMKEEAAREYFQQLIRALDYCHGRGVYHRDLKPENLLVDENGDIKVSDFGLSALAGTRRQDGLLHTTCGTPAYVSPEVISRKGYDGAKADIWSCGVILFVLLAGFLPFHDSNLMEMYRKISKAEFKLPGWIRSDARKLITRMLDPNPDTRIPISKIMEHPFFCNSESRVTEFRDTDLKPKPDPIPNQLNAFDIISLSEGLDLSGFFCNRKKDNWFISHLPAASIISKLEQVAGEMNLRVRKKDGGWMKLEGHVSIDVDIFEIAPFHLVEIKKCDGDVEEYERFIEGCVRFGLKDDGTARV